MNARGSSPASWASITWPMALASFGPANTVTTVLSWWVNGDWLVRMFPGNVRPTRRPTSSIVGLSTAPGTPRL